MRRLDCVLSGCQQVGPRARVPGFARRVLGAGAPALQPSWPRLHPPWGWVMRGGFEREVVSAGRQWGRAGVLGTLRPLSLIKAWRCRPTGEVWPHLALIRLRRPAVGSVLAHRPSETGALLAALPPHLVAQRRAKPGTWTTGSPVASCTPFPAVLPLRALTARSAPAASVVLPPGRPRHSIRLVSRPVCGLSAHPPEVCGTRRLKPWLPRGLGTGPHPVLCHPCLGDQAPCILPCHTPEGFGGHPALWLTHIPSQSLAGPLGSGAHLMQRPAQCGLLGAKSVSW